MSYLWDESLATGVVEVDEAHKTMFLWVNQLADAMKRGEGGAEVVRLLNNLCAYAAQHFQHEEGCMNAWRCPAAQANKATHAEFLAHMEHLRAECRAKGVTPAQVFELQRALSAWLRNHIMKVDLSLRDCVMHARH